MTFVRSATLRGFREVVTGLGGDPEAYRMQVGLPAGCLDQDDITVAPATAAALVETAAADLDCPDLGLRIAAKQSLSVLGPLAVALTNSRTLGAALDCLTRYLGVHSQAVSLTLGEDPDPTSGIVALYYRPADEHGPVQTTDLGLGFAHRVLSQISGGSYGLRGVELPYTPIAPLATYREFFGAPVQIGRPLRAAVLRFPAAVAERELRRGDDTIYQLAMAYLARRAGDRGDDLVSRVRTPVLDSLGVAPPTLDGVAGLMLMHPRTLQRQLAAAGTTFGAVVDDARREKALRLLLGTDLTVGQIGAMVGFDVQPSFTRAARRWWGKTPTQMRAKASPGDKISSSRANRAPHA
ncbi:AraC family transcriptional regulator [Skermania piniformis]|uniref:AraC family transcriptional regulator n=1 Tax=Skermania pinensis TaxID=39122 RepID=A0ABX8S9S8_9ACTN|nr:AraC family transcriptional regulator [Skermania piniformis]QXQ13932.1 AraC family transcriptional regulator [Skermania piniformis]